MEALGALLWSLAVLAVLAGAWMWILVLVRKGRWGLLGLDAVTVNHFENVVVYAGGKFDRILRPGSHWIWSKNRQLIRVDMRPAVFEITQGLVTSDHVPAKLRCMARIQITEPRAVIEATQNYRDEVCVRLQSIVRTLGKERKSSELQVSPEAFNALAQKSAGDAIGELGCQCTGFELLQIESSDALLNPQSNKIGFSQ